MESQTTVVVLWCCGAIGCRSVQLRVPSRRCPSQDMRAHTAVLQRISGEAPPRQRTNAGCLNFLGHASWSTKKAYTQLRNFVLTLTFSQDFSRKNVRTFFEITSSNTFRRKIAENIYDFSEKARVSTFTENSWYIFSRNFLHFFKNSNGGRNILH